MMLHGMIKQIVMPDPAGQIGSNTSQLVLLTLGEINSNLKLTYELLYFAVLVMAD